MNWLPTRAKQNVVTLCVKDSVGLFQCKFIDEIERLYLNTLKILATDFC